MSEKCSQESNYKSGKNSEVKKPNGINGYNKEKVQTLKTSQTKTRDLLDSMIGINHETISGKIIDIKYESDVILTRAGKGDRRLTQKYTIVTYEDGTEIKLGGHINAFKKGKITEINTSYYYRNNIRYTDIDSILDYNIKENKIRGIVKNIEYSEDNYLAKGNIYNESSSEYYKPEPELYTKVEFSDGSVRIFSGHVQIPLNIEIEINFNKKHYSNLYSDNGRYSNKYVISQIKKIKE